eukprot:c7039_g1_i2.p1 GENE.c7039_g1_i2~~c7039_g1_i2.p1  ORF type:complete len:370 (+),score=83.94 c7039_g1_i2:2-1111(+)
MGSAQCFVRLFMDELKEEIERQKKLRAELKSATGEKKWVRRGELEKEKQKRTEQVEQDTQNKKAKVEAEKQTLPAPEQKPDELKPEEAAAIEALRGLSEAVIFRRLRAIGKPIKIFGETTDERLLRLHKSELEEPELAEAGVHNEFGITRRQEPNAIQEPEVPMPLRAEETTGPTPTPHPSRAVDTSTHSGDEHVDESKLDKTKTHMLAMHMDVPEWTREQSIRYFFKHLLKEWEMYLENQKAKAKPTDLRKIALINRDFTNLTQTKEYIKPLIKQLKTRTLDPAVEESLGHIVDCAKQHEYQKAHDKYISVAIGNAAWPIGVTMTGIHERSAREKIQQNQVARILSFRFLIYFPLKSISLTCARHSQR